MSEFKHNDLETKEEHNGEHKEEHNGEHNETWGKNNCQENKRIQSKYDFEVCWEIRR